MMNFKDAEGLSRYFNLLKEKLNSNKKLSILILAALLVLISVVSLDNFKIAHGNENDVLSQTIKVQGSKDYSAALREVNKKLISFNDSAIRQLEHIRKDVDSLLTIKFKGYAVNVDGRDIAIFKTKQEADKLLSDIKKPYVENQDTNILDISFKEDIQIEEVEVEVNMYNDYEGILYYITKGTNETKIHKIEKGENFWVIAERYKLNVDDLLKANPDVKPEALQIGQEISLVVPKPFITVVTTERAEYTEYIPFEVEYEETSVLYKGELRVKKAGEKGEREVIADVIKENGIEASREIVSEKIIKNPVTKMVLKGTKNPPPRIGAGTFSKPTSRGYITSGFGWRWGRRHEGIDLGMPTGTDVRAADGGKVTYAGYRGSYGYLIIINHGANMETYYAHNSKLLVSKGDKVYKGQVIAKSGNTGRSTGPHLHFEVRKNGTPVNPMNYVKY